jgi:MFS transporter, PAT family, beta-lactamase induction signal transducer AmpG
MKKVPLPWLYVPTLYFAEGLPYIIVNTVSVIMYKRMGMSNEFIGLTSILYLPWVLKMFWSPVVDVRGTRRCWIISMQTALAVLFALLALSVQSSLFVPLTLAAFVAIAFVSATHDIAVDGYYMLALDRRQQAFFIGVRSLFYRLALLFGQGLLVVWAGSLEQRTGSISLSWMLTMFFPALVFSAACLLHQMSLPRPGSDVSSDNGSRKRDFTGAFATYFTQPGIVRIVLFILLYRLGEAMLVKMAAPFLLDDPALGGLGLSTAAVGYAYGTAGMVSLTVGGLLGGWLIARFGLRRCIWPMAVMLNAPDLVYIYMAAAQPEPWLVYVLVSCEQFGYGLGFTAFSVYLMYIAREPYKTSHFAISTGLMALGMMAPGMLSGYLQQLLGYTAFFTLVAALTIPGMVMICFLRFDEE